MPTASNRSAPPPPVQGEPATGQRFVLSNAAMTAGGNAAPAPVGTSGTTGTTYALEGESATLATHLNHRVEVTGTLQSASAPLTGATNAAAGATAPGSSLKVDSVKVLAETCAPMTTSPAPAAPLPLPDRTQPQAPEPQPVAPPRP